ncbi:MAG: DUF4352 domain-containing protein [Defluviitaleaceae bacterium]|nr:DUF4352 domain-containing protein [Defluviitaleaceae bacterium]
MKKLILGSAIIGFVSILSSCSNSGQTPNDTNLQSANQTYQNNKSSSNYDNYTNPENEMINTRRQFMDWDFVFTNIITTDNLTFQDGTHIEPQEGYILVLVNADVTNISTQSMTLYDLNATDGIRLDIAYNHNPVTTSYKNFSFWESLKSQEDNLFGKYIEPYETVHGKLVFELNEDYYKGDGSLCVWFSDISDPNINSMFNFRRAENGRGHS